jgi:hypothetical protein
MLASRTQRQNTAESPRNQRDACAQGIVIRNAFLPYDRTMPPWIIARAVNIKEGESR